MSLPQEIINMILYKFGGMEHPLAKIIKEGFFYPEEEEWKENYDYWNKEYFWNLYCEKLSGKVCRCGFELTNGDWYNEVKVGCYKGNVVGCFKCDRYGDMSTDAN